MGKDGFKVFENELERKGKGELLQIYKKEVFPKKKQKRKKDRDLKSLDLFSTF